MESPILSTSPVESTHLNCRSPTLSGRDLETLSLLMIIDSFLSLRHSHRAKSSAGRAEFQTVGARCARAAETGQWRVARCGASSCGVLLVSVRGSFGVPVGRPDAVLGDSSADGVQVRIRLLRLMRGLERGPNDTMAASTGDPSLDQLGR